ncbi:hypothetical protein AP285_02010 [Limnospira platensis YZ]|nr:hypothetical protein AP285_02010 [Arthrospira platensis YZ]KDR54615.1 hypothetical protein APPUASWS_027380 [Arthrospira platensis str. Paraca]
MDFKKWVGLHFYCIARLEVQKNLLTLCDHIEIHQRRFLSLAEMASAIGGRSLPRLLRFKQEISA